jgi:hypothetical protein
LPLLLLALPALLGLGTAPWGCQRVAPPPPTPASAVGTTTTAGVAPDKDGSPPTPAGAAPARHSAGATYYVSPAGSDNNPGTLDRPFATINHGTRLLRPGATLYLRAGTYAEALLNTIPSGSGWSAPVTVASCPGETAILRPPSGPSVIVLGPSVANVELAGLVIDAANVSAHGVLLEAGAAGPRHIRLTNLEVKNAPQDGVLLTRYTAYRGDARAVYPAPPVARPAHLASFVEPTYGTTVTRITGDPGTVLTTRNTGRGKWSSDATHNYTINSAWNADQSLLYLENILSAATPGRPNQVYLDGSDYAVKYGTPGNMPGAGSYDQRWVPLLAHKNEVILAPGGGPTLYWFDVVRNQITRSWALPLATTYIGNTKGNCDDSGRLIALGSMTRVFILDMSSYPTVRTGPVFDFAAEGLGGAVTAYTVSPSGRYLLVYYSSGEHLRAFDINPSTLALTPRLIPPTSPRCGRFTGAQGAIYSLGHWDLTRDPFDHDEDYVIGQNNASGTVGQHVAGITNVPGATGVGHVLAIKLADGTGKSLTDPNNEAYLSHISCRNVNRPGWCYASYYNDSDNPKRRFYDEIVALKLDGSGACERYALSRTDFTSASVSGRTDTCTRSQADFKYRSEAHPCPTPDGLRVIFGSNWLVNGTGGGCFIQAYVVDTRLASAARGCEVRGLRAHHNGTSGVGTGLALLVGPDHLVSNSVAWSNVIGIHVGGGTSGARVLNCTTYGNTGTAGVFTAPGARGATVRNTIGFRNTSADFVNAGIDTTADHNLFGTDPEFVSAAAGDFRLRGTSPAIDAGAPLAAVPTDLAGVPRPRGAACDLGAYEGR